MSRDPNQNTNEPSVSAGIQKKADFSDVVGNWIDDPEFDEIIASQRQIDPDKWE